MEEEDLLPAQEQVIEDSEIRGGGSTIYSPQRVQVSGSQRLRQIAKKCVDYGQRVQNSVFECLLDAGQCRRLQAQLLSIMDSEKDSLRFYYLGRQYEKKVEHFGAKSTYLPEDPLIL